MVVVIKSCVVINLLMILYVIVVHAPLKAEGVLKRCFQCRSRGELGNCKDPFLYNNATAIEHVSGVQTVPCASGWCVKILEGGANQFKDDEYGVATERKCFQRGPSDNEERCAPAMRGNSKVQMCFCTGDLCNRGPRIANVVSFQSVAVYATLSLLGYRLMF